MLHRFSFMQMVVNLPEKNIQETVKAEEQMTVDLAVEQMDLMKKRLLKKQESSVFAVGGKDGLLRKSKPNQKNGISNLEQVGEQDIMLQQKSVTNSI